MYKVYGPRQTPAESNNNKPIGLPQTRIRLVHPSKQGSQHEQPQHPNAARAARLSWTDEADTNLNVPDFLLKQPPSQDSRINRRQIGLGIMFVGAFFVSFSGVFVFSHYFETDAAQLLGSLRSAPAQTVQQPETLIAQASTGIVSPTLESEAVQPPAENEKLAAEPAEPAQPVAELPPQQVSEPPPAPVAEMPVEPVAETPPEPVAVRAPEPAPSLETESIETIPEAAGAAALTSQAPIRASIANTEATGTPSAVALIPEMVPIKPGQYIIPATRSGQQSTQFLPVELEAFQIAKTEVTRGQWQACADEGQCSSEGFPDGYFVENKLALPITSITTEQMMGFIDWINTKRSADEAPYRLPAEAEWIVAARGGSNEHTDFAWGETYDPDKIRSNDMLVPVDHSEPVHGLFGMSDNAAERVSGCWFTEMADGNCFRNLGIVRGPVPGRINEQSTNLNHRASRAKNIAYENIGFRLAQ